MPDFSDITTSKVRAKLIELFYSDITEMYHVRGVCRKIGVEINAVRRELNNLEVAGVIKKEKRGNRVYYWARPDYPFFCDFLSIAAKSVGIGLDIIQNRKKIGRINFVMFSGRFVRRIERKREDDVDILVVGDVILPELSTYISKEESKRKHEINYTVMSREEFEFRKKRRDPFLLSIFAESRVMIIGDEESLVS